MIANERLNQLLQNFISAGIPGCGLAVSYKGKIVYTGYCGIAQIDNRKKVDENTVYRIMSCTKNFTATAIMKLYEEGRLLLNDPLENYLPFFKNIPYQTFSPANEKIICKTSRPVTIKDLLLMTSGIPYGGKGSFTANDYLEKIGNIYAPSTMELARMISEIPLQFDPGSHWQYGMGYDVLGAVVEVVTGKRFGEYLKEAIFEPLGMKNTGFICTKEMERNLAWPYNLTQGVPFRDETEPIIRENSELKAELGGAGLYSTLGDLIRFAGMLGQGGSWEGKRILSRNTVDLMRKNHLKGQPMEDFKLMAQEAYPWYEGYGWGLCGRTLIDCQEAGSNGSVGEFGWCGMYGTYIMADPQRELAVAYVQQTFPVIGGKQDYCHPRIRNVVYSLLDEWEEYQEGMRTSC